MEICCHLVAIYGENVMSMQMIYNWWQQFKAGWESIDNEPHTGCSIDVHTDENKHPVEKLALRDCCIIVTELEASAGLRRCQIHQFVYKLAFQKICARWVSELLTEHHLMKRRASTLEFLTLYHCNWGRR